MSNYVEYPAYWIYNNNVMIIKAGFNENIKSLIIKSNIMSIIFTDYVMIKDIIENINNVKINKKKSSKFNKSVNNLPQSLQNLTFGYYFNQSVDNLPINLINLVFDCKFNNNVDNLPFTLLNITFGISFNKSVDNLPNSIITLSFDTKCIFNFELNCLPKSICEIKLPINYNNEIKVIYSNLKKIVCSSSYHYIDKFNKIDNIFIDKINKN